MNVLERAWNRLVTANAMTPHHLLVTPDRHARDHKVPYGHYDRFLQHRTTWKSHGGFRR